MMEKLSGGLAPNLEDVVVLGDVVVLSGSASKTSAADDTHTIGLITGFSRPADVAAEVASYLPHAPKSTMLVQLRWFLAVPKSERTFDEHDNPLAARCDELVLLREVSWMPVEAIVGVALVWHIDDVEAGTHPVEGMKNAYVVAHEESRKRKQSSPSVRGFSLQPVDAAEWTALAEDKAAGIDRFGRATMFTTRGGERWLAATTLRGLIHARLRKVSSKACRSFTLTIHGFTVRQWEVTGGVIAAAGPRSSTIKHVDTNSWASTAAGVDMRTSVEENVHELALDRAVWTSAAPSPPSSGRGGTSRGPSGTGPGRGGRPLQETPCT